MWYQPRRILELAGILVVGRPGASPPDEGKLRSALDLPTDFPLRLEAVEALLIDIASRDLRARVKAGKSIRYLVSRAVEAYLEDKSLYRS